MTPKFKYDPEHDCLREVARMQDDCPCEECQEAYQKHLASLRVIPCAPDIPDFMFKDGEEDKAFYVVEGKAWPIPFNGHAPGNYYCTCSLCKGQFIGDKLAVTCKDCAYRVSFPITPQPRLYTQAEAEDIWDAGFNRAIFECSPHNGKQSDKQQYFLTRFNVELTNR